MDLEDKDNPTYMEIVCITADPVALKERLVEEDGDNLVDFEVLGDG